MIHVGTSGFQYGHWRGRFYPTGLPTDRWLAEYASAFATVELNVTFYRLPAAATFTAWRQAVPDGFIFALKASRYITHVRRLRDPKEPVDLLLERARFLGDRLGPILVQLPPDLPIELERLDATLAAFPRDVRVAVEPRHRSWFVPETKALLEEHGAALCLADRLGPRTPLWSTAPWTYVRFHAGRASPRPCYGPDALRSWVARLAEVCDKRAGDDPVVDPCEAFAYFNNDPLGCAVRDAAVFARLAAAAGLPASRVPDPRSVRVG